MKNNPLQVSNPVLTDYIAQQPEIRIDILGYLGIIGFNPVELRKGKEIYKRITGFFNENQYDNNFVSNYLESWSLKTTKTRFINQDIPHIVNDVLVSAVDKKSGTLKNNSMEYHQKEVYFLETSNPDILNLSPGSQPNAEKNQLLANMIDEFNNWLESYVSYFSCNNRASFIQLVKLIVAQNR